MKLETYMREQKLSQADLARQLDVTQAAVSMWLSGERRPRFEMLAQIEKLTGGAVSANDFMPEAQAASTEAA